MGNIEEEVSYTKKMYGWSKWGGRTMGLIVDEIDEWSCQSCGLPQTKTLPSYMFPLDPAKRDYCRVCSVCKNMAVLKKIEYMMSLIREVRPPKVHLFTERLANLLDDTDNM